MSAEVATIKKRGRPPKKAVSPVTDNNVIVEVDTVASPLQQEKTRGKSIGGSNTGAKKSSPSTTTTAKGEVEVAVSASKSTVSSTTRKRAVKSSSTVASVPATALEDKEAPATTRTRPGKTEPVKEPEIVKGKAKAASEKTASPIKTATAKTPSQAKKQQSTQEAQSPLPAQETEGAQRSEILQQARAFAKSAHEPNKRVRRPAQDREDAQEASLAQQSGSEKIETASSRKPLQSTKAIDAHAELKLSTTRSIDTALKQSNPQQSDPTTAESPSTPEMPQATASPLSPSSIPSHLLTSNPLFGSPRPKYTLPYSTTAALASRQQSQQEQTQTQSWQRVRPRPGRAPARSTRPPTEEAPEPKKPTQMQYSELKRDPKFRELSSRWTRIIVALPIAIVTSYYLYQRRDEQRLYEESLALHLPGRLTGRAGGTGGTGGTGESSIVASNMDPGQNEQ